MKTWQVLWRLVRYSPGLYAVSLVLQVLRLVGLLVPGLVMRAFLDTLTGNAQFTWGPWGLLALLIGASVARVTILLSAVAVEWTGFYYGTALLRKNILGHLLNRPGALGLPYPPGDVVNRLSSDVAEMLRFLVLLFRLNGMAWGALIAVVIMASINPFITLMVFVPLALAGAVAHLAGARIENVHRRRRAADARVSTFLDEMFCSAQAIQVATAEDQVIQRFRQINESRRQAVLMERMFSEVIVGSFMDNIANLGTGVILLLASQSMRTGAFTVGDFSLFIYFLPRVTDFTFFFGHHLALYKQIRVSLERLLKLLEEAPPRLLVEPGPIYMRGAFPEVPHPLKTPADHLLSVEASGLTFRYPDSKHGIERVNLRLKRGSFTLITGRVGSGKTTLLRVLLGLLPKATGEIYWNGQLVADPTLFFVPPRSAYVPQCPRLFSGTLKDNILMGLPEDQVNLAGALRLAVMEQDVGALENGLETLIGPRGIKLSGGQAQRAAAARMFVREAELLVFDDLSSALDVETEHLLWEHLFERQEITCLVVSHRRAALRRADHIVVLRDGRVKAEGTLNELMETCEEMRLIWQGNVGEAPSSQYSE